MTTLSGSSPRVRGTLFPSHHGMKSRRIIPAGAGHTLRLLRLHSQQPDHPRGCGAHCPCRRSTTRARGSSPRVRGTRSIPKRNWPRRRIIPAGAGHTTLMSAKSCGSADHPRGCGAHPAARLHCRPSIGSSPRVRGTPSPRRCDECLDRIIPAGAGHTRPATGTGQDAADHPRGCGAHWVMRCARSSSAGSSPRVRGTPAGADAALFKPRIIPAGAGHTSWSGPADWPDADHPRGCGAHATIGLIGQS